MTHNKLTKLAIVGAVALTLGFPISNAQAQTTVTITSTAIVNNGFTVSSPQDLDFGTAGFFLDGTNDITYALSTADAEVFTGGGTSRGISIVGGTAAQVLVQAPRAAVINMVIPSAGVTPPTDGVSTFAISAFTYTDQSAGGPNLGPVALDTPVTVELDADATDETVLIGATLTADAATTYANTAYAGDFDVTFQY